ncbi:hypothetical protein [Intestinibacter bartlettii]|uniref:hypothetical protein n=1 Tax=Intestinibacter bartlettii TaxID=261299 RepID=UPI0008207457|nr:hypothetical protein [Intestinibacter bartlettii]SCJ12333.1 Uncharacterised protein [uncultured Clostridium sp.]
MNKEEYFRYIIIKAESQEDIEEEFRNLKNWKYHGIVNMQGMQYYKLTNDTANAKVLFLYDKSNSTRSINVLPIKTYDDMYSVYSHGYDFSENQPKCLKENILFDLCKEISRRGNVFCAISILDID